MSNNNLNTGQIEAAVNGDKMALRQVLLQVLQNQQATGRSTLEKIDKAPVAIAAKPAPAQFSVKGGNGSVVISITNPQNVTQLSAKLQSQQAANNPNLQNQPVYHELSSATNAAFTENVTTYAASTQFHYELSLPGQSLYWRIRSSFDSQNWNAYQVFNDPGVVTPVAAGLIGSSINNPNLTLNQSNYANIDSVQNGASAIVRVYNSISGPNKSWVHVAGTETAVLPSGTILNVPYGSTGYVAYDGEKYQFKQQLPQVFPDGWTPVGRVPVVNQGPVVLPTVTPVVQGGYIVGLSWTPGSGLTQIPIFTVTDPGGTGAGAIVVGTGISGGALTGMQILNAGNGHYDSNTTITPSGGIFTGGAGGGGQTGANPGRLYGNTT